MKRFSFLAIVLSAFLFSIPAAHATAINFDFNSISDGGSNSSIQTYMNNLLNTLHPGGTVTVSGAKGEKNYTGDDHVVGPVSHGDVTSLTLGNTDAGVQHGGSLDAFLINSGSDRISMVFSFPIYSVSFDYEIFPDGTCPSAGVNCSTTSSNWPDFSFDANNTLQFRTLGIDPSVSGPYSHSPDSDTNHTEKAPQFLGLSGEYLFPSGVTRLEFIDWPRMIGIDNLRINDSRPNTPPPTTAVPEPSSLILLGSGLLGLAKFKRKKVS